MTGLLPFVLGVVALMYGGAPILIRSSLKLKALPRMEPIDVDDMPSEVYAHFGRTAVGLEACGFALAAYIRIPDQVPNVIGYVAMWTNVPAGQAATAVVMYARAGAQTRVKHYTEFFTKVADGIAVLTNNSTDLSSFKHVPAKDTLYAADVRDIEQLYRLHLSRERRLAAPNAPRYLPEEGEELVYFAEGMEYDLRRQARVGYLYEADPGVYRPTWLGAYRMTWGELPPVKQVRRMFVRARVRRELRECEQATIPPPRNVPISHVSPYRFPP